MGWTKRGVVRINKLTAKQEDQIIVFAEKWDRIARSTEPWDEDAVLAGIKRFYKANGCRQPKRGFWYTGCPISARNSAGYKWEAVTKSNPNFSRLHFSEWGIRCVLTQSFEPAIVQRVEDFMHRNVARMLPAGGLLAAAGSKNDDLRRLVYGQGDADWLAIADYFATVHDNAFCKKLEGLMQAVASCGFVWLAPMKVVYCKRPEFSKFDAQGRLHCEDRPAVKYPGPTGWQFFRFNGVPIGHTYIETPADKLNLDEVLKQQNAAVRMALIRKIGFERLLTAVPNRVISRANGNSLIDFKISKPPFLLRDRYLRALHVKWQDKTGEKETFLPVPRQVRQFGDDCPDNINDCEQVRRWTLGWPKEALAVAET